MAGLCEGGNEPSGSLKAICLILWTRVRYPPYFRFIICVGQARDPGNTDFLRELRFPCRISTSHFIAGVWHILGNDSIGMNINFIPSDFFSIIIPERRLTMHGGAGLGTSEVACSKHGYAADLSVVNWCVLEARLAGGTVYVSKVDHQEQLSSTSVIIITIIIIIIVVTVKLEYGSVIWSLTHITSVGYILCNGSELHQLIVKKLWNAKKRTRVTSDIVENKAALKKSQQTMEYKHKSDNLIVVFMANVLVCMCLFTIVPIFTIVVIVLIGTIVIRSTFTIVIVLIGTIVFMVLIFTISTIVLIAYSLSLKLSSFFLVIFIFIVTIDVIVLISTVVAS
ncbi:hypothetical protein ANN_01619 [Periplaneta americana]|uniref:Uncharacterized protein n=1 Tax=Periplaneta americana TaxID=6978 RepID=A0ABQ8TX00_PERAM|nr:hypothetical protein ANN_01619 [Periplaneta americana]